MGFGAAGKAVRKIPKSQKAIVDFLIGRDTEGARLYKQMRLDGGTTGGLGLSTREQVQLDIEQIRRLNRSNPRKAAQKALQAVDNWNTIFEDATRFSVYRAALEKGLTRKQAATLAKEASINFNKKGTAGPVINGLYMFFNASIQGTTKMLGALKNPKVLGAVTASVGTAVYATNTWNTNVDPKWRDKVTKWDRSSNLVIVLPTEDESFKYITIPVSWGLKPIKVGMEYLYDTATGYGNIGDAVQGILTSVFEAYNPLAGDEDILNTFTPTILKTPVEIARNRAWYGNQIKPNYDPTLPESSKYFKSLENSVVGRTAIGITTKLSDMTSGTIEISPADANYAFNQYIGGVGRSITKVISTIASVVTDRELQAREIPVLSRFFKNQTEEEVLEKIYYNELEKANEDLAWEKTQDVRRIVPLYEETQSLVADGKEKEAKAIVNSLSEDDYEIYKRLKASDKRRDNTGLQIKILPVFLSNRELVLQGKEDEALQVVNNLTDEEYEAYKKVKDVLGDAPTPKPVEEEYNRNIFGLISDYARAFATDPGNAFKALFTEEKLGIVEGNLVELQRFYGIEFNDEGGSQEYKRNLMAEQGIPWSEAENWKLEHIVPVKAGGDSSDANLLLANNELHNYYTPIDIAVGNAVRAGKITRKQAEQLMKEFKITKEKTAEEVIEALLL